MGRYCFLAHVMGHETASTPICMGLFACPHRLYHLRFSSNCSKNKILFPGRLDVEALEALPWEASKLQRTTTIEVKWMGQYNFW
jgi:hypothetical protein